ncbi:MAG: YfcE family phosphodiesterase [Candidatus Margulisbacteria bacterium]|nr:YfcE family phosphodiesterase [Candidatus Margulisiibacteriota bacterium]MBU1021158.1 YfcE family phosphodiesterase [Candidatus Margulisiibacteriota bacterium]MBU1729764.1 YfcE family phosphodiesterase [Candidatus Margulisiibacteriota bacterium]MBU1955265.1 YfcE family phosphodiesterase [Candidatus Margulisiibacteriota bacterium]
MKIGLVSDSHGNIGILKNAIKKLVDAKVDLIIHLGDDSTDMDTIKSSVPCDLIIIPGVFEEVYQHPGEAHRLIKTFEGLKFLITHTAESHKNDLSDEIKPEEIVAKKEVDVVLHGHTHVPRDEVKKGIRFINPGHLKPDDKRGFKPSYAILDVNDKNIDVRIIEV